MEKEVYCEREFLGKLSFYEKEIILLGKESSIMRRKCFWEKEFCQEKEVLLLQRVLSREGGSIIAKDTLAWGGSSILFFLDKEVLVWKKSSTKKRKFYFGKRILFQMRRKLWYGKVPLERSSIVEGIAL